MKPTGGGNGDSREVGGAGGGEGFALPTHPLEEEET